MWVGTQGRLMGVPSILLNNTPMVQGRLRRVVLFEFYRKPMARETPLLERTALPEGVKVATVANEIIRRCKNVSRDLPTSELEEVLQVYMEELAEGGYPLDWRVKCWIAPSEIGRAHV